jgi:hypothetical protein
MRRSVLPVALAAIVAVPALSGFSTASQPAALDGSVKVQLWRNLLPGIASLSGTEADPSHVLDIGVALQRPDPAGEDALLAALYDPTSPSSTSSRPSRSSTPASGCRRPASTWPPPSSAAPA